MIRVLLADDNVFVRSALVDLLSTGGDIEVVAECADGDEVVPAAEHTRPDVVILDLAMARVGGLEAARRLLAVQPEARIVILTATLSAAAVREAHDLGVVGYLLKDAEPDELPGHVRTVAAGGTAWRPATGPAPSDLAFLTESTFSEHGPWRRIRKPLVSGRTLVPSDPRVLPSACRVESYVFRSRPDRTSGPFPGGTFDARRARTRRRPRPGARRRRPSHVRRTAVRSPRGRRHDLGGRRAAPPRRPSSMAEDLRPDIVVMDIQMGREDGLAATRRIRELVPDTVVAVVTAHRDPDWVVRAAQAGASAFIPKNGSLAEMLDVLGRVRAGQMLVAPSTFAGGRERLGAGSARSAAPELTRREQQVLDCLGQGMQVKAIARVLGITQETCRGYVKSLHVKLGARSQLEAVVKAQQLGLLGRVNDH